MVVLFALVGLLIGWLLNWTSERLPHRNPSSVSASPVVLRVPSTLSLLMRQHSPDPWLRLHLGAEWLTAVIFGWLGLRLGLTGQSLLLAAGYALFALIAVIDWKYRLILNIIVYPAIVAVLVIQLFVLHHDPRSIVIGGVLAFAVFYLVAYLKPGQLGGGDVKLAALIGLTFGFPQVLLALLVGAGVGAAAALLLLARRAGLQHRIPYAPFLCFGAIVILMYYSLQMTL